MKQVYLNEYNISTGNAVYLPYASGLLQAYAQNYPMVTERYEFMPIIFKHGDIADLVARHKDPAVAAFSVSIWNYKLSCAVAQSLKSKYPDCVIVFGGPSAVEKEWFMDYVVKGEGEKAFVDILLNKYSDKVSTKKDIDDFTSPYTTGVFDNIMKSNPEIEFKAIIETARGCPFSCSFCYWGHQGGLYKKFRYHGLDYIRQEAEWIGKNKIKYIFISDSNFGMSRRDIEAAKIYAQTKEKYGYPEKVRVCYGKGQKENLYQTALVLHKAGIGKAVTLSRQSTNESVLGNVNRRSIPSESFNALQERFDKESIPTYSELILGLPGETKESFIKGVKEIMQMRTRLFIYHCTVLPNTEMASPEYQSKHGIKTARIPLRPVHCNAVDNEECEDIVIETNTMTTNEWIECAVFSWLKQLEHGLGYDFQRLISKDKFTACAVIDHFYAQAIGITKGHARCEYDPEFGDLWWEPEEMAFLKLHKNGVKDLKRFAEQTILYGRKGGELNATNLNNMSNEGTT